MTRVLPFHYSPLVRRRSLPSAYVRHALALSLCGSVGIWVQNVCAAPEPAVATGTIGGLPDAPRSMPILDSASLQLELVVNGVATGNVVTVIHREGRYFVEAAYLKQAGLRLDAAAPQWVAADSIDGVQARYDEAAQQLRFSVPPAWLPRQRIGADSAYPHQAAVSSLGALMNYDLYYTHGSGPTSGGRQWSAWLEQRVFDGFGFVSNTGVYRRSRSDGRDTRNGLAGDGYVRYDTYWRFSDEDRLLSYSVGDLVTGSLAWSGAVRIGGAQIERNFGLRPDLVTYPLPSYSGEAAVPTALDLYINGYKASSAELQPGPYTIDNVPFVNGAGEATVITRDALGRQVSLSVPFYITSTMLKPGLTDFSASLGKLRRGYGEKSFDYGDTVASGSLRHGLTDHLTLESHVEAAPRLALAGIGGNIAIGRFGTLNLASTASRFQGKRGNQTSIGYTYYATGLGLALQHTQRSRGYVDLGRYARLEEAGRRVLPEPIDAGPVLRSDQLSASIGLSRGGSLGMGYFDIRQADNSRLRLATLSYSKSLGRGANLYFALNRELASSQRSAQLQLVIPLSRDRGTVTFDTTRDRDDRDAYRATYSRPAPTAGGLGWNLAAGGGAHAYRQADLTWRAPHFQLMGGVYGESGAYTRWGDLSGALVLMDRRVFASNSINDAFVLVSTDGQAGVPVSYENQIRGFTDRGGHLLIPSVTSYYRGRYAIDPLNLPIDVVTPKVEDTLTVRAGSGALLRFPAEVVRAANVKLVDEAGAALPAGLPAALAGVTATGVTGWDGWVYFEGLGPRNTIRIVRPDASTCVASFELQQDRSGIAQLGPIVCREEP